MSNESKPSRRRRPEIPSLTVSKEEAASVRGVVRRMMGGDAAVPPKPGEAPERPARAEPRSRQEPPSAQELSSAPERGAVPARKRSAQEEGSAQELSSALARDAGYTQIPNAILDAVLPRLSLLEQAVYLRLYRLSYGFRSETCTVGFPALAKSCHCTDRAVRTAINRLEDLGLVERIGATFNAASGPRGNIYRVAGGSLEARSRQERRSAQEGASAQERRSPIKEDSKNMNKGAPVADAPAAPAELSVYDVRRIAARLYELHHGESDYTKSRLRSDVRTVLAGEGREVDERLLDEAIGA